MCPPEEQGEQAIPQEEQAPGERLFQPEERGLGGKLCPPGEQVGER